MPTNATRRLPFSGLLADPVTLIFLALVVLSILFLAFPEVDLAISRIFYDPELGFYLGRNPWLVALRHTGRLSAWVVAAMLLASIAVKLVRPDRPSPIAPSKAVFLLATFAIGPGLVVNGLFKSLWGRPRPVMIDAFGGDAPFIEAWRISDYCARNCSFVSGEASSAIWLLALTLIVPARWRVPVAIAAGIYALALSANRIAFGGHFASDVVLAWCLTLLVMVILYRVIIERPPAWLANDRLEAGLARLGRRLRGAED